MVVESDVVYDATIIPTLAPWRDGLLRIPCGENDHWGVIRLSLFWEKSDFDASAFNTSMGLDELGVEWTLQAAEGAECHTHGRLTATKRVEPDEEDEEAEEGWVLTLRTYREAGEDENIIGELSRLMEALRIASTNGGCFVWAFVGLAFPSQDVEWRPGLLSRPPELTELKEDLGRIVVAGLTLRFEESPLGLHSAGLDVLPGGDHYTTELTFSDMIPVGELPDLYRTILTKSEGFASLFLDFTREPASHEPS